MKKNTLSTLILSSLSFFLNNNIIKAAHAINDINKNEYFNKELIRAIKKNDGKKVNCLLKDGVNVNIQDDSGNTPLHWSIKALPKFFPDLDIIKYILKHGANVNIQNNNGNTPLHLALINENAYAVKLFLEKNDIISKEQVVMVNIQNNNGDTPLHLAVQLNNAPLIKVLLNNGANTYIKNNNEEDPIKAAISYYNNEVIINILFASRRNRHIVPSRKRINNAKNYTKLKKTKLD